MLNMTDKKTGKRTIIINISDDEEDNTNEDYLSPEESNIFRHKRKRTSCSASIESEKEQLNGNTTKTAAPQICWMAQNLNPKIYSFDAKSSGCKVPSHQLSTPLDCFQIFFSESLVNFIVQETNKYHEFLENKHCNNKKIQINSWHDTDVEEMYCFLGTTLLMSQVKKVPYSEYWSSNSLLKTDMFKDIISQERYLDLLRFLHFSDPNILNSDDKLIKIRELVENFRLPLKQTFYPFQNICVVESSSLFKGRLSFKQFHPSKRNLFGVKSYVACDCTTGYIFNLFVYSASGNEISEYHQGLGVPGNVVMKLVEDCIGKGHTLYVDNWCTSPMLFTTLHLNNTNACGIVGKSCQNIPVMLDKLQKDEISFRSNEHLLCLKWQSNREVWMLTTCHSADIIDTDKIKDYRTKLPTKEPTCVQDYNHCMGILDKTEMVSSTIESLRKNCKWYKKYFFHLLDISIWNAFVLYKYILGKKIRFATFYLNLIRQIYKNYVRVPSAVRNKRNENNPMRLTERHFPATYFNPTAKKTCQTRKCVVCSKHKLRRESRYQCKDCDVGLCIDPCFRIYHTVMDY